MSGLSGVLEPRRPWTRNPVFRRELLTLLRSRKSFALLAIYLALTAAVVLGAWPREAGSLRVQGEISRQIFSLFAAGQIGLLALMIPATLGSAMTLEKEGRTIDLLLTTPVSADQILLGKLLSGLFYFLLLGVVAFPVLLLCAAIGGLGAADVAGLAFAYFLQAAAYGMTSLACSVCFHRTHVAVIVAYVLVAFEAAIMAASYGDGLDWLSSGRAFGVGLPAAILLMVLYIALRKAIRRPFNPVPRAADEEDVSNAVGLVIRRDQFPDTLIAPKPRRDLLADGVNPVLDKELQAGVYGGGSLFVRLVIQLGALLSLGAMLRSIVSGIEAGRGDGPAHVEYPFLCFIVAYVVMLAPALGARMFATEKEEDTLEALALTLLPRRWIVMGKAAAVLRVVTVLALMNCVCFVIVVVFVTGNAAQLAAMGALIVSTATLATAVGVTLSLFCRSTLAAMVGTYFVLFALYLGPVLLELYATRVRGAAPEEAIGPAAFASPFLACRMPPEGSLVQLWVLAVHALLSVGTAAILLAWATLRFEYAVRAQMQNR